MTLNIWHLSLAVLAYLATMFGIAYAAEHGRLPARWVHHPITGSLSLGVYATAWTYYGGVGLAASSGYLFLAIYLGATLSFMLAPLLLRPLLRLVRNYQLSSPADVFAFRFPSRLTGALVTILMLMGLLPYIALQIDAVVTSASVLTGRPESNRLALGFCAAITLFAVLFGARSVTPDEKHEGLVAAIAFESAVKLIALFAVGAYALFGVLGGRAGLAQWTAMHPQAVANLYAPVGGNEWTAILVLAFSAAFLLPRQFQMTFTENTDPRALDTASWAFPLFLLLLNLSVPLILWAGQSLNLSISPDYYLLALTQRESSGWLTPLAFIGGVSAASAMIIVESLSLAAMALNHLVLPLALAIRPARGAYFYQTLLWSRRLLIAAVIFTGYAAFLAVERSQELAHLGLISFVAVAQFLPATLALLYWPRATRIGFLLGVTAGMVVWFLTLVMPVLNPSLHLQLLPGLGLERWSHATFWTLAINSLLFIMGSLLSTPSDKELAADQACRLDAVLLLSPQPRLRSVRQLESRLARQLGVQTARTEISRAMQELGLANQELRARQLHFLRDRVERNLFGLIGPQLAQTVLADPPDEQLNEPSGVMPQGFLVEEELERSRSRLHGLAAELNELRRFHRQVLLDLPVGVCSLGADREVMLWNERLTELSGISAERALGEQLAKLAPPWGPLLDRFVSSGRVHDYKLKLDMGGAARSRWLNLHHETLDHGTAGPHAILLVEDLTDQQRLETELAHSERLASIGMFAAGIAHEIGNPLTGISSLTQNLREEHDPEELRIGLDDILEQTRRISDIVHSLLKFAHAGTEQLLLTQVDLGACVQEAIRLIRLSPTGRQMEFDTSAMEPCEVLADRGRLLQVFVNLLGNAADASEAGATICVSAAVSAPRGSDSHSRLRQCTLRVSDSGCGIPDTLQSRVFEPFFTTKEPGRGTGLGLPLVYSIVREHGGSVHISSRTRGDDHSPSGTTVVIRLPCEGPALSAPTGVPPALPSTPPSAPFHQESSR